jgi:hypothetical protein
MWHLAASNYDRLIISNDNIYFSNIHTCSDDYEKKKKIVDNYNNNECRQILRDLGIEFYGCVDSIKSTARSLHDRYTVSIYVVLL